MEREFRSIYESNKDDESNKDEYWNFSKYWEREFNANRIEPNHIQPARKPMKIILKRGIQNPQKRLSQKELERYIEAWRSGSPEPRAHNGIHAFRGSYLLEFHDHHSLSHSDLKQEFGNTFSKFHDLEIKTRSLHGHKHFTAWEWTITCKHAIGADGGELSREDALPKRLVGCTLMWWDDSDRIVRNHEYVQVKEVEEKA